MCKTHYMIQINYEKVGEFHLIISEYYYYICVHKKMIFNLDIDNLLFLQHLHIIYTFGITKSNMSCKMFLCFFVFSYNDLQQI